MNISIRFDICSLDGMHIQWTEKEVEEKLKAIGRLNDKKVAHLESDSSSAPELLIDPREMQAVQALWRGLVLSVDDVRSSQHILIQIRHQISPTSSLIPIFNHAISKFNQIAPQYPIQKIYSVPIVNNSESDSDAFSQD